MTRAGSAGPSAQDAELDLVLRALRVPDVRRDLLELTQADRQASCRVLDAKYSPGRACTVLYAVGEQLVSGEVALDQETASGVHVRLRPFPEDARLPALPALADPVEARSVLAQLVQGGDERVVTCTPSLLRYRAGRRATVRLSGRLRHRSGAFRKVAYVVKLYDDVDKAGAVAAEAARLGRSRAVREGVVDVAPLQAFLPGLPAVAWGAVDGLPLDLVLTGSAGTPRARAAVRRAGHSLARLHDVPGVSERRRPAEQELVTYVDRAARAATVSPHLAARLTAVLGGLGAELDVLDGARESLLHGDCKPSQFLVSAERLTVLDLDSCRRGDPASDLGTFLATLRQRDLEAQQCRLQPRALMQRLAEPFLDGYCRAAGIDDCQGPHLRARATWFEALALQRKALRAFARAPRSPLPLALAAAAETVLAGLVRRRT